MRPKTIGLAAASLAAVGAIALGGASIASAAEDSTASPSPSTSASASSGDHGRGSQDTAVTGSESDKVIAAVKAEDSAATIDTVRKDPDGSYDALGTKDGSPVFYEVSADLKTVTANTHGPGGGHGPDDSSGGGTTSTDPSDANTATTSATTTATV
ncbi:hypothetical protein [Arthrobacter sp. NEB 688]|uniref:hypothetical protein n=1 Tax=Arthrobacter sp. NEB 688 TaxID=904039 RepID=UPI001563F696|nr:hypothetical protein [Arthrobacter sp. NEB 688]QKE82650.1 hypothetical protein HL663_00885 [Arthrobacter sp. NEB 688]